jgi:hypothetical protein
LKRFDNDLVWALAAIIVVLIVGSYYEAFNASDQVSHKTCASINDGRANLNHQASTLRRYITTALALNMAVDKIQPPPAKLVKLQGEEVAALKRLRAAQKPLPLVACP